jgi:hypothetical protein
MAPKDNTMAQDMARRTAPVMAAQGMARCTAPDMAALGMARRTARLAATGCMHACRTPPIIRDAASTSAWPTRQAVPITDGAASMA